MFKIDFTLSPSEFDARLAQLYPQDIAHELKHLNASKRLMVINALDAKHFIDTFIHLEDEIAQEIFILIDKVKQEQLLSSLEIDDLKSFVDNVDDESKYYVFSLLTKETQESLVHILSYNEDSAGSLINPHFITLRANMSIKEATNKVIVSSGDKDEVGVVFVLSEENHLLGAIKLQDLILARANSTLSNIMDANYPKIYTIDSKTDAINVIRDYDIAILPVVNKYDQMVGIITSDDALTLMQDSHEQTMQELVAVGDFELDQTAIKRSIARLPWLLTCVLINLGIAFILTIFKPVLDAYVALVMFMPMILGMAGNIGTQSFAATLLKLHRNPNKDKKKHVNKEVWVGVINSILVGLTGFGAVMIFFIVMNVETRRLMISMIVGISLTISMVISAVVGVMLPYILRRFKADEKAAGGPVITTINDFVAQGLYLLLASILLIWLV